MLAEDPIKLSTAIPNIRESKEIIIALIKNDVSILKYCSQTTLDDEEILKEALIFDCRAARFAPKCESWLKKEVL